MQILLDNNGYVKEWVLDETQGQMGHADALIVPNIPDLDVEKFYKEFKSYKLEDGKLVKDSNRMKEIDNERANKKKEHKKKEKEASYNEKLRAFIEALPVEERSDANTKLYFDLEAFAFKWK